MDTFVTVVGNLTDDPELRFTPNGTAVANFRLAVTPRIREGDTWKDGETSFFRVNAWRELAANVAESLGKGHRAVVIGRLRTRSWETQDGTSGGWWRSTPTKSPRACGGSPPRRRLLAGPPSAQLPDPHRCGTKTARWGRRAGRRRSQGLPADQIPAESASSGRAHAP